MSLNYYQQTVARQIDLSGVGVHSGVTVNLTIKPAPANHGITFLRKDLPDTPAIKAIFNQVIDTSLATVIGSEGVIVSTIEHLMAAFFGFGIDNAIVELDGYEMPILDGSAAIYTKKILEAGVKQLESPKYFFIITAPIEIEEAGKSVKALPSRSFTITCSIDFNHPMIQKQTYTHVHNSDTFASEIGPARTFGFYRHIEHLKRFGLGRGATLDSGIALLDDDLMNPEGLRYKDEFVRHKLLDCLGDFSLIGMPIIGHIYTEKSGHAFNYAFIKKFFESRNCWDTGTLDKVTDLTALDAKNDI